MSAPQPDESDVDHGEVHRRDEQDVTPVGPMSGSFGFMTALMIGVVVFAGAYILITQLL